jgi:hypothetical protein
LENIENVLRRRRKKKVGQRRKIVVVGVVGRLHVRKRS